MIFLALDYGARRLGLALGDEDERFAWPLQTLTRRPNDTRGDLQNLLDLMRARGVTGLVLGVPGSAASDSQTSLSEAPGAAISDLTVPDAAASDSKSSAQTASEARRFAARLLDAARAAGLELAFFETDERFSSAQAHGELRAQGVPARISRDEGGANSIDARAAAVFLQTFLDSRRHSHRAASDIASDATGDEPPAYFPADSLLDAP